MFAVDAIEGEARVSALASYRFPRDTFSSTGSGLKERGDRAWLGEPKTYQLRKFMLTVEIEKLAGRGTEGNRQFSSPPLS